jgi:hypothetical protein
VATTDVANTGWSRKLRVGISACISLVALVLAGLYIFSNHLNRLRLDGKTVGFLVAAALPWLIDHLESFKGFGFEFKRRLDEQSAVIKDQQELINLMFWFSMEADMFDTLKSLVEADPFTHNPNDNAVYPIVNAQLKELFNRGYVNREPTSIGQGENIGGGRIVTPLGKRFVYERNRLEAAGGREKLQKLSPLTLEASQD